MIRYKVVRDDRTSCSIKGTYQLKYKKNKTVKAAENSLGIFCFKRKMDAEDFIGMIPDLKIIRVKPIGKGKIPKEIGIVTMISKFYLGKGITHIIPSGTICYPAVLVLD